MEQANDAPLDLPVNCRNTDDTLLERVRLDDDTLGTVEGALSDEQLAYVLVLGLYERRTTYADELQKEKLRSFIDKVRVHIACVPLGVWSKLASVVRSVVQAH